jgi:hypothetical protein
MKPKPRTLFLAILATVTVTLAAATLALPTGRKAAGADTGWTIKELSASYVGGIGGGGGGSW